MTVWMAGLAARGLPATVFVAPGLLDGNSFWWDAFLQPDEPDLPERSPAPSKSTRMRQRDPLPEVGINAAIAAGFGRAPGGVLSFQPRAAGGGAAH